jgi:hypothetical protein
MKRVRVLVGFYAGLVMEYPDHVAETLLDTGFAEPAPPGAVLAAERESGTLPPVEVPEKGSAASPTPLPEWPLKMTPEVYLDRHPGGAKVELARRILEAGGE